MTIEDEKETLQARIRSHKRRTRALETALQDVHRQLSIGSHPLLVLGQDSSSTSQPLAPSEGKADKGAGSIDSHRIIDAANSLSIIGKTEGAEIGHKSLSIDELILPTSEAPFDNGNPIRGLAPSIVLLSNSFPLGRSEPNSPDIKRQLLQYLPPEELTKNLANIYFNSAAAFYPPFDESIFYTEILQHFYEPSRPASADNACLHKLSTLFLVLSLGGLLEDRKDGLTTYETYNSVSERYYQLARASFSVEGLTRVANTWTVAVMLLIQQLSYVTKRPISPGCRDICTLATQTVYRIGMHKDPSHWNVSERDGQVRRILFWEVCLHEYHSSLIHNQPPTIDIQFSDCLFAQEKNGAGGTELEFRTFMHRITAGFLSKLAKLSFTANSSAYSSLLELEWKFRVYPCPPSLCCPLALDDGTHFEQWSPNPKTAFQQFYACVYFKECALLHAHRKYVVQAIRLDRHDPFKTRYAQSIKNSIRSAGILLGALGSLVEKHARQATQVSLFWNSAFSALTLLGSLALINLKCASSSIGQESFELGVNMFRKYRGTEDLHYVALSKLMDITHLTKNALNDPSLESGISRYNLCMTIFQLTENGICVEARESNIFLNNLISALARLGT